MLFSKNIMFGSQIEGRAFRPAQQGFEYYPYGRLGLGYLVTAEQKAALIPLIRIFYVFSAASIGLGVSITWLIGAPLLAIAIICHLLVLRKKLSGVPRIEYKLSFADRLEMAAATTSKRRIICMLVSAIIMTGVGIVLIYSGIRTPEQKHLFIGLGSTGLFGLSLLLSAKLAWIKWRGAPLTPTGSAPPPRG